MSEGAEPHWLSRGLGVAIHADQIRQHGGAFGVRDEGLLESALERPRNRWHYRQVTDLLELAGTYCVGVARNHPFIDGNKRTAFQVMYVFLGLNGLRIEAAEPEVVELMLAVATGGMDEHGVAEWLSARTTPR